MLLVPKQRKKIKTRGIVASNISRSSPSGCAQLSCHIVNFTRTSFNNSTLK
ncbi:hypothetical protein ACS0TY_020787 [Phlomoides rotata]